MAEDGGSSKRLKTAEDDGPAVIAERLRMLRRRNAELESENEQLRRRVPEGNHEVLPVSVVPATIKVDLSRIDASLVTQITSFLGTSLELLNLALTCKSFGRRQAASTLNWSLVEEVARQAVSSTATDAEMSSLPRYVSGVTTWLSILDRFERLLIFDVLLGGHIEYANGDKTTVYGTNDYLCTAASNHYVMSSGAHYAEFRITGVPWIGIVRPMPNLDASAYARSYCCFVGEPDLYPVFLAQRSDRWGDSNVCACQYQCENGYLSWTDWDEANGDDNEYYWEGMEGCRTGDTVGMLLNLDEGTLTVYKNNLRLGVMKDGLSGSYCWYVTVADGSGLGREQEAVSIQRGTLLPL